jgi:hypothetical protein
MPVPVPNKDPYMNYFYCASGPDEKMVGRIEDAPSKKDKLPDLKGKLDLRAKDMHISKILIIVMNSNTK